MKSKPVFIQYPKSVDGFLKGAMFECPTPAVAKRTHPEAKIVRYVDGESYDESTPKKTKSKARSKTATARTRTVEPSTTEAPSDAPQDAVESTETNATSEVGS